MPEEGAIIIKGAKANNLKDIDLTIPRGKFVVITGISGSGKSSLAFDTLYAEGQRRFAQSLSSYARQFIGGMSKPDVESITGLPPAVAIEQKVNTKNPRSTVATITEIYDYLRLMFAHIGRTYSPISGDEVKVHTANDVMSHILSGDSSTVYLLAELGWRGREDRVEELMRLKEEGYSRCWVSDPGGSGMTSGMTRIDDLLQESASKGFPDDVRLLVDRVKMPQGQQLDEDLRTRLRSSIANCFSIGGGTIYVVKDGEEKQFINRFEADGMTFREPDEYMFSFNSPLGACPHCGGLGKVIGISEDLVVPDKTKSIYDGAIACWRGEKMGWFKDHLVEVAERYGIPIFTPYCDLTEEQRDIIWNGRSVKGDDGSICGINEFFDWVTQNRYKVQYKYMLSRFSGRTVCPECKGSRLRKDALYVRVGGKDIHELLSMNVEGLLGFFDGLTLTDYERSIVSKAMEEVLPPQVHRRRRAWLPDPRPQLQHPLRRRDPEDQPCDRPGELAGGEHVHPRRAIHRAAPKGHRQADRSTEEASRPREHGDSGGA